MCNLLTVPKTIPCTYVRQRQCWVIKPTQSTSTLHENKQSHSAVKTIKHTNIKTRITSGMSFTEMKIRGMQDASPENKVRHYICILHIKDIVAAHCS